MKSFRVSSFNPAPIRNIVIMGQLEHKGLESQSSLDSLYTKCLDAVLMVGSAF